MKRMKILVACEESQAVTKELRRLGHEAYSCDLIECSGGHPEWHIRGNALNILEPKFYQDDFLRYHEHIYFATQDGKKHCVNGKWDMIIAHPPCTYLSKASACRMYPKAGEIDEERFNKAMAAKDFFMAFYSAKCPKIAIENPTPLKCIGLPNADQVIQPYQFGERYSKRTLLWLKGLPKLQPTNNVEKHTPFVPSNTSKYAKGGGGSYGTAKNTKTRSKTFPGIARAMAEQWAGPVTD